MQFFAEHLYRRWRFSIPLVILLRSQRVQYICTRYVRPIEHILGTSLIAQSSATTATGHSAPRATSVSEGYFRVMKHLPDVERRETIERVSVRFGEVAQMVLRVLYQIRYVLRRYMRLLRATAETSLLTILPVRITIQAHTLAPLDRNPILPWRSPLLNNLLLRLDVTQALSPFTKHQAHELVSLVIKREPGVLIYWLSHDMRRIAGSQSLR